MVPCISLQPIIPSEDFPLARIVRRCEQEILDHQCPFMLPYAGLIVGRWYRRDPDEWHEPTAKEDSPGNVTARASALIAVRVLRTATARIFPASGA